VIALALKIDSVFSAIRCPTAGDHKGSPSTPLAATDNDGFFSADAYWVAGTPLHSMGLTIECMTGYNIHEFEYINIFANSKGEK
jgi:hypothetical protein